MGSAPSRLCEKTYNVTCKVLDIVQHCRAFVLKILTGSGLGPLKMKLNVDDLGQPAVKLSCQMEVNRHTYYILISLV